MRDLAKAWPVSPPATVYAGPLRRSLDSAILLADAFRVPLSKRPCLKEWTPDESGIPQDEYKALEQKSWADLDSIPPSKESLAQASTRGRRCIEEIAATIDHGTCAVVGHGTLFSLVTAALKGTRPTEAYKSAIGFADAAIVEVGSGLRLLREFRHYGPAVN